MEECTICLEYFQMEQTVIQIQLCNHIFHPKCLESWFTAKMNEPDKKCPLCAVPLEVSKLKEKLGPLVAMAGEQQDRDRPVINVEV